MVRIDSDADARRDSNLLMGQFDRFTQRSQQSIGECYQLVRCFQIGDEHQKFVPTQAGSQLIRLQAISDPFCQSLEQFIAHPVPQTVVDQFETIQIDKE